MKTTLLLLFFASYIIVNAQTQNAIALDGIDDYMSSTYAPPTGNVARTVEAYIKTTANAVPNAGGRQQIITDYGSLTTGGRFTFCILFNNAIRLEVSGSGVSGTIPVNDGNWHHVAAVYEPSNSSGTVALYVDGILDVRATPSTTVNTGTTERFTIGRRIDNVNFFTGSIDEVRFWNRALNPNEINTNRTVELCPSTSGLTAYFQFDQGVAGASNTGLSSVPNLVSNNNGTLTNLSLNGMVSNWVSGAPVSTLLNSDVSLNSGILSVAQTAATYQWVNCATGNIVPGATSATFAPTTVGNYAVDITLNSCTQRSSCTVVSTLGNETTSVYDIYLLQNPSQELLFTSAVLPTDRITVHTLAGSKLVESNAVQVQTFSQTLTSGIYLVTLSREAVANQVFKWVKM